MDVRASGVAGAGSVPVSRAKDTPVVDVTVALAVVMKVVRYSLRACDNNSREKMLGHAGCVAESVWRLGSHVLTDVRKASLIVA